MRYFHDSEFIDGPITPTDKTAAGRMKKLGIQLHGTQLISIGIRCEDGREYYAINSDFNPADASDWVKENVLSRLEPRDAVQQFFKHPSDYVYGTPEKPEGENMNEERPVWKPKSEIAKELEEFFRPDRDKAIKLYGYYSAHDHVVLASIWGAMVQMPQGMPWYTIDLKQEMDRVGLPKELKPADPANEHHALADARWNEQLFHAIVNFSII